MNVQYLSDGLQVKVHTKLAEADSIIHCHLLLHTE